MRKKNQLTTVTSAEVQRAIRKTETVQLRLSTEEKEAIKEAASKSKRTVTEYLLECHRLIASKIK